MSGGRLRARTVSLDCRAHVTPAVAAPAPVPVPVPPQCRSSEPNMSLFSTREQHELRARVAQLERELAEKEALVRQLRADLDKCQQVLKEGSALSMAEIAPWRVGLEPRFKRLAISAEPLALPRSLHANSVAELKHALPVNRQPKSAQ